MKALGNCVLKINQSLNMRRLAITILKARLLLAEICSLCLNICKMEVTRLGCPASFFFFFNFPIIIPTY